MKQKSFCWAALVFWLLAACTLLSLQVEKWMIPQVLPTELLNFGGLTMDALFLDEAGQHVYSLMEGTGWESGTRVLELSENDYKIMEGRSGIHVLTIYSDTYVLFSSKPLVNGEAAQVLSQQTESPDLWLAVAPPELLSWEEMPEGMEILAKQEDAVLVRAENAKHPFLPNQGKKTLRLSPGTSALYSLGEFSDLCGQFSLFGLLGGILVSAFLLWGYSFGAIKTLGKNRRLLLLNSCIFLGLLIAFSLILGRIELPSSLLPREGFLDIGFYAQQFSAILSPLKSFAAAGSSEAQILLKKAATGYTAAITLALACIVAVCGIIGFEILRLRNSQKSK